MLRNILNDLAPPPKWPIRKSLCYELEVIKQLLLTRLKLLVLPLFLTLLGFVPLVSAQVSVHEGGLSFRADKNPFRYGFSLDGHEIAGPADWGIQYGSENVKVDDARCGQQSCVLRGTTSRHGALTIRVRLSRHHAELSVEPGKIGFELRFRTRGATPAFGLGDHARLERSSDSSCPKFNTDVSGFSDDHFLSGEGTTRLVSNFVIFPKHGFAEILIDPQTKIIHVSGQELVQGVLKSSKKESLHYFFGTPKEMYAAFSETRRRSGYAVMTPKFDAFQVGWEAFGALGWDSNATTVWNNLMHYRSQGFPIRWVVLGSGFWPDAPAMRETTSFGLWDTTKYPDAKEFISRLHANGFKVLLGLRITFITSGPFAEEGVRRHFFLEADGQPHVFTGAFPKLPYYVLDSHNPQALTWYFALVNRWKAFGVDGFKEDFFDYGRYGLRDDKVDPVNDGLMKDANIVIERNGYLSLNGDVQRIEDFNFNQDQDRGPVNALALAYSGFPNVYPDIVGGTFGENRFATHRTERMNLYMGRNAQWAALHSSMSFGEAPWTFSPETEEIMKSAAVLHERFAPYFFSYARKSSSDGFPWTLTPLPLAFPTDSNAYGRENSDARGYEWMIGEALLATPLYGNDYASANTRNVYLPKGRWMDFDSGKIYGGGQMLRDYPLPPGKTPLFVGGTGVTLERHEGKLFVCVYPVARRGSVRMTLPDGSRIVVNLDRAVRPSSQVRVRGKPVSTTRFGFAMAFPAEAGRKYQIN